MTKKTISIIGSGYSGSSAIYEYLVLTGLFHDPFPNKEFSLCYDPGGLMDINYVIEKKSLIDNHNFIYNRFKQNIRFYVDKLSISKTEKNSKLEEILERYLNNLVATSYNGQTSFMNYNQSKLKNFLNKFFFKFNKSKNDKIFIFKSLQNFNKINKKLFFQLFLDSKNNIDDIILDQGGLYSNPLSSTKYYQNPYCIIVDRDPRDIYVEFKFKSAFSYPKNDVNNFCEFYINQKKSINLKEHSSDKILKINFENFILENKKSVLELADFLDKDPNLLLNNINFDLDKSKKNIYKYKSLISDNDNKVIKRKLKNYII